MERHGEESGRTAIVPISFFQSLCFLAFPCGSTLNIRSDATLCLRNKDMSGITVTVPYCKVHSPQFFASVFDRSGSINFYGCTAPAALSEKKKPGFGHTGFRSFPSCLSRAVYWRSRAFPALKQHRFQSVWPQGGDCKTLAAGQKRRKKDLNRDLSHASRANLEAVERILLPCRKETRRAGI